MNDNGTLVYTEAVMGQSLKDYMGEGSLYLLTDQKR